jgi:thioredoxin 1
MEILLGDEGFHTVIKEETAVLVDFYSKTCEPCKWLDPILDQLSEDLTGQLKIIRIDVDRYPEIASEFSVLSVPTLILFKKGENIWRMNGFDTAPELKKTLLNVLNLQ